MDKAASRLWLMRSLYLFLAMLVMFFHLLPLDTKPDRWPFPELLIGLTFAWVLRRPDFVPIASVTVVMLMADFLLQRPPGLLAALVVLGTAYLRSDGQGIRDIGFLAEWTTVAVVTIVIFVLNRLILALLSVEQAALGPVLVQTILTVASYPLVVLFSQSVLGVRRPSAADNMATGVHA
ncbi:MreD protein [Ruegeria lacuscaerulensis ITI-1157]|nr:MreD protein [Ruegeria lacuscaerulensis ITI-1157]SHJ44261.1 rod shape-determining protein MreD [Ruegeria lacuscaerulensis ITI-1157]